MRCGPTAEGVGRAVGLLHESVEVKAHFQRANLALLLGLQAFSHVGGDFLQLLSGIGDLLLQLELAQLKAVVDRVIVGDPHLLFWLADFNLADIWSREMIVANRRCSQPCQSLCWELPEVVLRELIMTRTDELGDFEDEDVDVGSRGVLECLSTLGLAEGSDRDDTE